MFNTKIRTAVCRRSRGHRSAGSRGNKAMAAESARLGRRFSLGSLLVAALSTLALVSAPTAAAQEVPDANCPEPPNGGSGGPVQFAQTFTALNTGKLVRARASVFNFGGTGDYVLSIHTVDASGVPARGGVATTTANPASAPGIEGLFAAPADVVAAERYALVVSRPGGAFGVNYRDNNPCPGSLYSRENSADPFTPHTPVGQVDMVFAVFVIPTSGAPGEFTCKGERVTIAGTPQGEKFDGTPGRDVIAALGGNDKVFGLGGKDLICGGTGRDTLAGGKGKDNLLGQKGRDTLKGGGGKDLCAGAKGDDSASGCEKERSM